MRPKEEFAVTTRSGLIAALLFAILGAIAFRATADHGVARLVIAWPAAGYALAAAFRWGYRILPGIALGSLAVQIAVAGRSVRDAVIISAAVIAQALIGAAFVRLGEKKVGLTKNLRETFVRLTVAATVGSGIVPFVELYRFPGFRVGSLEFGYLWVYRWSAEAIGTLVVLPLTLLWVEKRFRATLGRLISSGMLVIVLLGWVAFFQAWNRSEVNRIQETLTRRALSVEQALRRHLNLSLESVKAIAQFINAEKSFSRDSFNRFVSPYFDRDQGARAFEWIERVFDSERPKFEARIRGEGGHDFEIRESVDSGGMRRKARAPTYYPIAMIEPLTGNEIALGYDVSGTSGALRNLEIACDSGGISLSDPLKLIQETGEQSGVVGYYPVYRGGKRPPTPRERREALIGVVGGVFRVGDFVTRALSDVDLDDLEIHLSAMMFHQVVPLAARTLAAEVRTSFEQTSVLEMENQRWRLVTALTLGGIDSQHRPALWMLPIGGVIAVAFTLLMTLLLTGRSAEIESLIVERTAELRHALGARDEFLLAASHELKTPLTPLRLQVEFLQELLASGRLEEFTRGPEFAPMLEGIGNEVKRYSRLVEDLLDFSRLSSEKFHLILRECDLGELARKVVEMYSQELARVDCRVEISVHGRPVGNWDPMRLQQVVVNLLSNAIRYAPGKPIGIRVEGGDETSRLIISDRGIGIAPADFERIFERFVRLGPVSHYGGLGIGLFIVRELVQAHGGTVSVQSEFGSGSSFTIELPNAGPDENRV